MRLPALLVLLFILLNLLSAQTAEDYGFRYIPYEFEGDTIHVLIKSKKGEEQKKKPIFFSAQGSKASPLIIHNGEQRVYYATMEEGFVEDSFHLVIVNKPGIPLVAHKDSLVGREYFIDKKTYQYPKAYLKHNHLDYYVNRNLFVLKQLIQEEWVDTSKLVVAGHSQGSSVGLYMCDKSSLATHFIYSGGLPYYSTILAMVNKERMKEGNSPNPKIERIMGYWKEAVKDPLDDEDPHRDSNLTLSSFSQNENEVLKRLPIPVLISYGTKDESSPYHDMFRIESIRERITHITFNYYVGLGHNYQLTEPDENVPNQQLDFLEEVMSDWLQWLQTH
ncbi:MAG: hypothetical protein AAFY71_02825 [Bacteroidota bacterium]